MYRFPCSLEKRTSKVCVRTKPTSPPHFRISADMSWFPLHFVELMNESESVSVMHAQCVDRGAAERVSAGESLSTRRIRIRYGNSVPRPVDCW